MSIQSDDPLYTVFEECLHSGLYDNEPVDKFVKDVVDAYWGKLLNYGHIPYQMQELLRMDLVQEVHDMLRAKTYGHYGIGEYNKVRRTKSG